jgi:hypothetical protein
VIISTPNNESARAIAALWMRGHFVDFGETAYPFHKTALLKTDLDRLEGHLGRCYLKGRAGDAANVILSAVGYNLRLVLAWLRIILRVILLALLQTFTIRPALKPAFLTGDEFERGAAAKTEGEDRNNGKENRHHRRHGTISPPESPAVSDLWHKDTMEQTSERDGAPKKRGASANWLLF